jgi:pyridoxamine 5'-phosphate oxidase
MPQSILPSFEDLVGMDPLAFFARWFQEAQSAGMIEPSAMALATSSPTGEPAVRIVLLRRFDERGFVFFTNYLSRKGAELAANPRAALAIHWADLQRQVRIEGNVEQVSSEESDSYFRSRPHGHQLGALVSKQSQVVANREVLESLLADLTRKYADQAVPRPEHWGGYRVIPHTIEFWQGRENRLHDRLRFRRQLDGAWLRERLAP